MCLINNKHDESSVERLLVKQLFELVVTEEALGQSIAKSGTSIVEFVKEGRLVIILVDSE